VGPLAAHFHRDVVIEVTLLRGGQLGHNSQRGQIFLFVTAGSAAYLDSYPVVRGSLSLGA
jgi:hypothetical protein